MWATGAITAIKRRLGRAVLRAWMRRRYDHTVPVVRLGTEYGGWYLPECLLADEDGLAILAGVGEDASLEVELLKRSGLTVLSMDPTPRAIEHVAPLVGEFDRWDFVPVGLWSSAGRQRFYEPADPGHVSHSIGNLQGTDAFIEVECTTLSDVIRARQSLDLQLLKMDIEGAEFAVISSMLRANLRPFTLAVEFDQPCSFFDIRRQIIELEGVGYKVVALEGWNVTLVCGSVRA